MWAWGYGAFGQHGRGHTNDELQPQQVGGALEGKKVVSIGAGFHHSLAVCDDGAVFAWGQVKFSTISSI